MQKASPNESGNAESHGDDQSVLKAALLEHLKVVTPDKKANSLGNKVSVNQFHPPANQSTSSVPVHASLALSLPFFIATTPLQSQVLDLLMWHKFNCRFVPR
jgi:hypothetical protein